MVVERGSAVLGMKCVMTLRDIAGWMPLEFGLGSWIDWKGSDGGV